MERLQKVIAASGIASRRKAEELIVAGKVTVNGVVVTELGTKVKKSDIVLVGDQAATTENKVYFLLYKPKGYISAVTDDLNRSCVSDLLSTISERTYPVGRLDYDSTGALFMTNDGEFANLIMHPSSHMEKTYEVTITGLIDGATLHQLETGIFLEGAKTLPCKIRVTDRDMEHKTTMLRIKIVEGKNRQVRKMFEAVGHDVKRLHRSQVGHIDLKGLKPGEFRILKPQEVKDLRRIALERKEANKNRRG